MVGNFKGQKRLLNIGLSSFPNNGNGDHYQRQDKHDENKHLEAIVFYFYVARRRLRNDLQGKVSRDKQYGLQNNFTNPPFESFILLLKS